MVLVVVYLMESVDTSKLKDTFGASEWLKSEPVGVQSRLFFVLKIIH